MHMTDLMSLKDLTQAIEDGFVRVQEDIYHGFLIYNYTSLAMVRPEAWDNPAVRICRGLIVDPCNYDYRVVARPWEKFFGYSQEEAGEIDLSAPAEVSDKADGCFSNKTRLNLWGGGTITIGEVVKNKLTPTLIGMNADGDLVPSRVTNWFDNGLKYNWLRVGLSTPASSKSGAAGFPNRMFVTPNHQVLHGGKYVPIGSLKVGDSLTAYVKSFSGLDLFVGGLLGDGSVCKNGNGFNYQEGHGEPQRKYIEEQRSLFSDGLVNASDTRGGYADSPKVWLQVQNAQVFEDLRNEWYPEGIKRVPYDLSFMNDAVVAKWCMDDGTRTHSPLQQDRAIFHTNGFIEEDVRRLAAWLEDEYGVTAKVFNSKGWSIRINYAKGTIHKFWEAVAPYIFPSMDYKLPEEYRGKFAGFPAPSMILLPVESRITSIEEDPKWQENNYGRARTRAYDIETETHNYMCQGVLVHNSLGIIYLSPEGLPKVATRGSFNSDQAAWASEWLCNNQVLSNPNHLRDVTYLVEIIYPENRIVLNYGDYEGLRLLGGVDIETGRYIGPNSDELRWGGDRTEVFSASTLAEALALPPREGAEGMCVRFLDTNKIVKIKQDDYLELHRLIFGINKRAIWELAYNDGNPSTPEAVDSFLEPLPDEFHSWIRGVWNEIWNRVGEVQDIVAGAYSTLSSEFNPKSKEFAMAVQERYTTYQKFLFSVRSGQNLTKVILKSIKKDYRGDETPLENSEE